MPSFWARSLVALTSTVGAFSHRFQPGQSQAASGSSSYDYIIIGGGPAGIVAATRLVQEHKSVLLLERGNGPTVATGSEDTLSWNDTLTGVDVPGLSTSVWTAGPAAGYACPDTPSKASACILGGGAEINYMVFVHPPAHDFDDKWPQGWKWADIAPAAERVYSLNPGSMLPSADGKRYDQGMYDTLSTFLKSVGWKSVNQVEQPNEKHEVYSYPNWDVGNQLRTGPVRSYLPQIENLDNFSLRLNTTARRIVRNGGCATGVEVESASGIETIKLNEGGKVILAAGTWGTPRVLFNSGIGPKEQIENVQNGNTNITLPARRDWIELPVGQGLKDHSILSLTVQTNDNFTLYNATTPYVGGEAALSDIAQYEQHASGVLTQGYQRLFFWTSNVASDGITRYFEGACAPSGDGEFTIKAYQTHGLTSKGCLGIEANGTTSFIEKPYLKTDGDVESMRSFVDDMVSKFQAYPGWSLIDFTNTTALLAEPAPANHFVGTAVMGTDRKTSVVDTNVKLHDTDNIYVVDASMHPDLPTGNSQAIVMIAAEAAVARIISPHPCA